MNEEYEKLKKKKWKRKNKKNQKQQKKKDFKVTTMKNKNIRYDEEIAVSGDEGFEIKEN